jgi:hypothetical protein
VAKLGQAREAVISGNLVFIEITAISNERPNLKVSEIILAIVGLTLHIIGVGSFTVIAIELGKEVLTLHLKSDKTIISSRSPRTGGRNFIVEHGKSSNDCASRRIYSGRRGDFKDRSRFGSTLKAAPFVHLKLNKRAGYLADRAARVIHKSGSSRGQRG